MRTEHIVIRTKMSFNLNITYKISALVFAVEAVFTAERIVRALLTVSLPRAGLNGCPRPAENHREAL